MSITNFNGYQKILIDGVPMEKIIAEQQKKLPKEPEPEPTRWIRRISG